MVRHRKRKSRSTKEGRRNDKKIPVSKKRSATNKRSNAKRKARVGIGDARLERALRVLSQTKDINAAARSIRVSVDRLKRAAKRRKSIRRQQRNWVVVGRLRRKMPIFSGGRQLAVTVRSKSASLIARYMSAVGQFLKSNKPKFLAEFRGRSVKDISDKIYPFETDPNVLYRLSSAGGEPFEEMYRIIV